MRQAGTNNRRGRRGGFTLLEVLIVVGIIALLAAFVVPNLIGASEGAKIDIARSQISSSGPIATAIQTFRVNMQRYPDSLSELTEKPDDGEEKWRGPYIEDASKMIDPWGNDFEYKFPGTVRQDSYDLWSTGPDAQDGTEDDIKNWKDG